MHCLSLCMLGNAGTHVILTRLTHPLSNLLKLDALWLIYWYITGWKKWNTGNIVACVLRKSSDYYNLPPQTLWLISWKCLTISWNRLIYLVTWRPPWLGPESDNELDSFGIGSGCGYGVFIANFLFSKIEFPLTFSTPFGKILSIICLVSL